MNEPEQVFDEPPLDGYSSSIVTASSSSEASSSIVIASSDCLDWRPWLVESVRLVTIGTSMVILESGMLSSCSTITGFFFRFINKLIETILLDELLSFFVVEMLVL